MSSHEGDIAAPRIGGKESHSSDQPTAVADEAESIAQVIQCNP